MGENLGDLIQICQSLTHQLLVAPENSILIVQDRASICQCLFLLMQVRWLFAKVSLYTELVC